MPCDAPSIVTSTWSSTGAMALKVAFASLVVEPIPPAWFKPIARLCRAAFASSEVGPVESLPQAETKIVANARNACALRTVIGARGEGRGARDEGRAGRKDGGGKRQAGGTTGVPQAA